ncbi:cation:proton antiporter domain-containing protein [Gillisia marina]|uniref:cation:proton antiporter domain-containing protein n=1 Tax=Gillisia marina TaxID=1167637 RepID=UPI000301D52D|nr:cation:proton antiporter [Gillisia marina]
MDIPILKDIVIILGLSIFIILLFQKIKVPSLLGFLLAGIIAGPYAFNLISSQHEVELLSEIGIIFLLFIIGIELSLKGLAAIKKNNHYWRRNPSWRYNSINRISGKYYRDSFKYCGFHRVSILIK